MHRSSVVRGLYRIFYRSLQKMIALSILVFIVTGCANQTFTFNRSAGVNDLGPVTQHYWFWGIQQSREVDAAEVCHGAHKIASIRLQTSLSQFVLSVVTLGIYSPREVVIRCLP